MIRLRIFVPTNKALEECHIDWSSSTPTQVDICTDSRFTTNHKDLETAIKIIRAAQEVTKLKKKEDRNEL